MGLTVNSQARLDELFDKFAVDPKQPKTTQKPKDEKKKDEKDKKN
ncbi:SPJ_0845 family protein [Liquorilactobacillus hordei]